MNKFKKPLAKMMVASLGLVTFVSVWYCILAGYADAITLRTRSTLNEIKSNGRLPVPLEWNALQVELAEASSLSADAPIYYDDKAYLYAIRGVATLRFTEIARPNLQQGERCYLSAIKLRPMDGAAWANLALIRSYLDDSSSAGVWQPFDLATLFAENDPSTKLTLAYLGFKRWDTLSDQRKANLLKMINRSDPSLRHRLTVQASSFGNPNLILRTYAND